MLDPVWDGDSDELPVERPGAATRLAAETAPAPLDPPSPLALLPPGLGASALAVLCLAAFIIAAGRLGIVSAPKKPISKP